MSDHKPLKFLDVGAVANTHGVHGEIKINCNCDSPEFLRQFGTLYINGKAYAAASLRVHKNAAIVKLNGIDTVQEAQTLKGAAVTADMSGVTLPEGRYFIADLIGLPVIESGVTLGTLSEILTLPAHDVYVLDNGRMIPNVPEFVKSIDGNGIQVSLIEGM